MQQSSAFFKVALVVLGSNLSWALNDTLGALSRTFEKCGDDVDFYSCLKTKGVRLLDRALAVDSLQLSDHVTIARDPDAIDVSPTSRDMGDLDAMLVDRLRRYLRTRSVRLSLPHEEFEGRKGYQGTKGGKGGGIFLVFGAFAAMLLQLALGKLAAIAGKALLVGKVALLLAGIVGLKSLVGGHSETQTAQVVYAEPEHHGSWGRSIGKGANVAYRGQKPNYANN